MKEEPAILLGHLELQPTLLLSLSSPTGDLFYDIGHIPFSDFQVKGVI